jgi:hypothetical protein
VAAEQLRLHERGMQSGERRVQPEAVTRRRCRLIEAVGVDQRRAERLIPERCQRVEVVGHLRVIDGLVDLPEAEKEIGVPEMHERVLGIQLQTVIQLAFRLGPAPLVNADITQRQMRFGVLGIERQRPRRASLTARDVGIGARATVAR